MDFVKADIIDAWLNKMTPEIRVLRLFNVKELNELCTRYSNLVIKTLYKQVSSEPDDGHLYIPYQVVLELEEVVDEIRNFKIQ